MSRTVTRSALTLPRLAVAAVVLAAGVFGSLGSIQGSALAGSPEVIRVADRDHRGDSRRDDHRYDARRDRRDWRDDRRDERGYDNNRGYRDNHGWHSAPRYRPAPPPRYWVPPRSYYDYRHYDRWPYWRQSYGRGYRYWDNGHHYFVEPGRPAVELTFVLPLR